MDITTRIFKYILYYVPMILAMQWLVKSTELASLLLQSLKRQYILVIVVIYYWQCGFVPVFTVVLETGTIMNYY